MLNPPLGLRVFGDADDQKIVALARFAGDRFGIVRLLLPGGDLDAAGLLLVRMRFERRRGLGGLSRPAVSNRPPFDSSAAVLWSEELLSGLAAGFSCSLFALPRFLVAPALAQIEDRGRLAAGAGDGADQPRRKFAVGAVVGGEQQPLQIGHEALGVELLALEPQPFLLAQRQALERPAQHRRHRQSW